MWTVGRAQSVVLNRKVMVTRKWIPTVHEYQTWKMISSEPLRLLRSLCSEKTCQASLNCTPAILLLWSTSQFSIWHCLDHIYDQPLATDSERKYEKENLWLKVVRNERSISFPAGLQIEVFWCWYWVNQQNKICPRLQPNPAAHKPLTISKLWPGSYKKT